MTKKDRHRKAIDVYRTSKKKDKKFSSKLLKMKKNRCEII